MRVIDRIAKVWRQFRFWTMGGTVDIAGTLALAKSGPDALQSRLQNEVVPRMLHAINLTDELFAICRELETDCVMPDTALQFTIIAKKFVLARQMLGHDIAVRLPNLRMIGNV